MYGLNEKKMFCDIADGIAIVINSQTGMYYGFNEFGTAVFAALTSGADSTAVLRALRDIPGHPDDMESRLAGFIADLEKFELIVAGPTSTEAPSFEEAVARDGGFLLEVKEYADAQEMLLADPIHDVDEEIGWEPVMRVDDKS